MHYFQEQTKSKGTLIPVYSIAIGVWILILQNSGVIPISDKKVIVVNPIVSTIDNTVDVNVDGGYLRAYIDGGYIDVENTVSISIDEVLGTDNKKYYFRN